MDDLDRRSTLGGFNEVRAADRSEWTDESLIEAVRGDPPDEGALDVLARRHWKPLFARCRMLATSDEDARDLAQSAWVRVLRARQALDPMGNFPGYLSAIATNLWRDQHRSARRAGAMSDRAIGSFEMSAGDGDRSWAEQIADPNALPAEAQSLLAMELDGALARLKPRSRDVLIARYLDGEPAAEIARREGRTEQAITGWIRQALGEMRTFLADLPAVARRGDES
jgi:RNA polymerase sigma factor (sigma-70 family)